MGAILAMPGQVFHGHCTYDMDYIATMPPRQSYTLSPELEQELHQDPLSRGLYPLMFGLFIRDKEHEITRSETRPDGIIIAVAAGSGWYQSDIHGQKIHIHSGQMLVIPGHAQHAYGSNKQDPWTIYWSHIDGTDMQDICLDLCRDTWHHDIGDIHINLWQQCLTLYQGAISLHHVRRASGLLRQILARGIYAEAKQHEPFADVIRFMEDNLCEKLSLDDLAEQSERSRFHFSRQFLEYYGSPPHRYFLGLKMQQAAHDIDNQDGSIADIALRYGYEDQFYFSRIFKKIIGYSPRAYKNLDKG